MSEGFPDLRNVFLFQLLSSEEMQKMSSILHKKTYLANEKVFSEQDYGDTMYIINKGTVKIAKGPDDKELITLYAGDFFGEIALFERIPRTASAISLEETTLFEIRRDEFGQLSADNSTIGMKIMYRVIQDMAKRIRRMNIQFGNLFI